MLRSYILVIVKLAIGRLLAVIVSYWQESAVPMSFRHCQYFLCQSKNICLHINCQLYWNLLNSTGILVITVYVFMNAAANDIMVE